MISQSMVQHRAAGLGEVTTLRQVNKAHVQGFPGSIQSHKTPLVGPRTWKSRGSRLQHFCVIEVLSLFIIKFLFLQKQPGSGRCEGEGA